MVIRNVTKINKEKKLKRLKDQYLMDIFFKLVTEKEFLLLSVYICMNINDM